MKKLLISICLLLPGILSIAQDQNDSIVSISAAEKKAASEIVTDRPDATESSSTVPKNTLQIETGIIFESFKDQAVNLNNWALGTTLLRYGVWDNFELRLGSYYQYTTGEALEIQKDSTDHRIRYRKRHYNSRRPPNISAYSPAVGSLYGLFARFPARFFAPIAFWSIYRGC